MKKAIKTVLTTICAGILCAAIIISCMAVVSAKEAKNSETQNGAGYTQTV